MSWIIKKELVSATSIYGANGKAIATVQAEEQASLIEAAPDLYKAAIELLESMELEPERHGFKLTAKAFEDLRKAVSKARGGV
jgi:hypothetical protein